VHANAVADGVLGDDCAVSIWGLLQVAAAEPSTFSMPEPNGGPLSSAAEPTPPSAPGLAAGKMQDPLSSAMSKIPGCEFLLFFFFFSLHGINPYHQDGSLPPKRHDHLKVPRGTCG
jgi:hypothetical protein